MDPRRLSFPRMPAPLGGSHSAEIEDYRSVELQGAASLPLARSAEIAIDKASMATNDPANVQMIRDSARRVVANQVLGKFVRMNMQAMKKAIQVSESPAPTQLTF